MQVTRTFWIGVGFGLPPSLALLALALWYAANWWLVGIIWLLCAILVLELAHDAPTAESLGIPNDDKEEKP